MKKKTNSDEDALLNLLRDNIKKYRHRKNWSQAVLASKIELSTQFLADIEAGTTWVSVRTLVKLAKVFEIEAYELLMPEKNEKQETNLSELIISRFSQDLSLVLRNSFEKSIKYVKKQYSIK
jgi:transcriptional regulator with XRE-family HTH domain